jgi:threonine aldolase
MKLRMDKMKEYWQHAKYIAEELNKIDGIRTVPQVPVCNMFHAYFEADRESLEAICTSLVEQHSLGTIPYLQETQGGCMSEFSFGDSICGIPRAEMGKRPLG